MSDRTKDLRKEISSLDQEISDLQKSLNKAIESQSNSKRKSKGKK